MKTSQTITKIAPAFLNAQKEIGSATKEAVNPFFKSKYADLGAVMEACKEALNKNGISVLQPVSTDESGTYVETVLLHESGEFIADRMDIQSKAHNDPQAQGSAITYARRYGLQSMLFIPAEDDDGEKATQPARKEEKKEFKGDFNFDKKREYDGPASEKQLAWVYKIMHGRGFEFTPEQLNRLDGGQCSKVINGQLQGEDLKKILGITDKTISDETSEFDNLIKDF